MKVKFFSIVAFALVLSSCFKIENQDLGNQNAENKASAEVLAEFANSSFINVNITSEKPEYVSIFFDEPYDEEGALLMASLTAKTPVITKLLVPNHVDSLTVIKGGEFIKKKVGDILISDAVKGVTRSETSNGDIVGRDLNFKKIVDQVNNVFFPETVNNIKGDDLYLCTDLTIKEDLSESEFTEAEAYITYLSDGFYSRTGLYGKLWAYSYPTETHMTYSHPE